MVQSAAIDRLFRKAGAHQWALTREEFSGAVEASIRHAFREVEPERSALDRYLESLHVADLALAAACALGREAAWDHFVLTHRPVLYRAADALAPGGTAREAADSLYAELYGLRETGERRSLFRYFHGRSSLATWLRSVLAQRHVDTWRAQRRTEPLDEEHASARAVAPPARDPDRDRLVPLVERATRAAIEQLPAKDRLRLRSYYVSQLTLAEIGRVTGEHEATVSRHLAKTRRALRDGIEQFLRDEAHLAPAQVSRALELALEDPGELSLPDAIAEEPRKEAPRDRST